MKVWSDGIAEKHAADLENVLIIFIVNNVPRGYVPVAPTCVLHFWMLQRLAGRYEVLNGAYCEKFKHRAD